MKALNFKSFSQQGSSLSEMNFKGALLLGKEL